MTTDQPESVPPTEPRSAPDTAATADGYEPIKVVVTETIEYELTLDPTDPNWEWLLPYWHNPDEVVDALNDVASNTEGSVEQAIRSSVGPSGSWREVTHP